MAATLHHILNKVDKWPNRPIEDLQEYNQLMLAEGLRIWLKFLNSRVKRFFSASPPEIRRLGWGPYESAISGTYIMISCPFVRMLEEIFLSTFRSLQSLVVNSCLNQLAISLNHRNYRNITNDMGSNFPVEINTFSCYDGLLNFPWPAQFSHPGVNPHWPRGFLDALDNSVKRFP